MDEREPRVPVGEDAAAQHVVRVDWAAYDALLPPHPASLPVCDEAPNPKLLIKRREVAAKPYSTEDKPSLITRKSVGSPPKRTASALSSYPSRPTPVPRTISVDQPADETRKSPRHQEGYNYRRDSSESGSSRSGSYVTRQLAPFELRLSRIRDSACLLRPDSRSRMSVEGLKDETQEHECSETPVDRPGSTTTHQNTKDVDNTPSSGEELEASAAKSQTNGDAQESIRPIDHDPREPDYKDFAFSSLWVESIASRRKMQDNPLSIEPTTYQPNHVDAAANNVRITPSYEATSAPTLRSEGSYQHVVSTTVNKDRSDSIPWSVVSSQAPDVPDVQEPISRRYLRLSGLERVRAWIGRGSQPNSPVDRSPSEFVDIDNLDALRVIRDGVGLEDSAETVHFEPHPGVRLPPRKFLTLPEEPKDAETTFNAHPGVRVPGSWSPVPASNPHRREPNSAISPLLGRQTQSIKGWSPTMPSFPTALRSPEMPPYVSAISPLLGKDMGEGNRKASRKTSSEKLSRGRTMSFNCGPLLTGPAPEMDALRIFTSSETSSSGPAGTEATLDNLPSRRLIVQALDKLSLSRLRSVRYTRRPSGNRTVTSVSTRPIIRRVESIEGGQEAETDARGFEEYEDYVGIHPAFRVKDNKESDHDFRNVHKIGEVNRATEVPGALSAPTRTLLLSNPFDAADDAASSITSSTSTASSGSTMVRFRRICKGRAVEVREVMKYYDSIHASPTELSPQPTPRSARPGIQQRSVSAFGFRQRAVSSRQRAVSSRQGKR